MPLPEKPQKPKPKQQKPLDVDSLTVDDMNQMLRDWQTSKAAPAGDFSVSAPAVDEPTPIDKDLPKLNQLKIKFATASKKTGVPVEILAGIASRESNAGRSLNKEGYDPEKQAYGIMQVDQRFHKLRGTHKPDSQEHINQSADIVRANKEIMDKRFPHWTEEQRWRAAVAGYNMGPGNVKSLEKLDVGTTGNNYSEDVMLRAKAFKLKSK